MPSFSKTSYQKLSTCEIPLVTIFMEVIKHFDCTILTGHRNEEDQNKAFNDGKSQIKWPNGKHNSLPSKAVDVAPYPIDWGDRERMNYFAGFVKGIATSKGIEIRWGGDWDNDTEVKDNSFDDLVHFELK